jgi:small subunit ribosomal protein S17
MTEQKQESAGSQVRRQTKVGIVVSDAMDKTVTVSVAKIVAHPLYQRATRRMSKFAAHDENNECRVGDEVLIVSSRPLSKRKRWRVREILKRSK